MIKTENFTVFNFENAVRGMRNPMNSWDKSDSKTENGVFVFGENDLALAEKLCAGGSDHRKFLRQIFLSVDITAPLYWWKEFDTYKVGTCANSTSTMHRLHSRPITIDDFSCDRLNGESLQVMQNLISRLESIRQKYIETGDKSDWYEIIQLLPSSYNQLRTATMSYENLVNIHRSRKSHKLAEWVEFCRWIETLPYADRLVCGK